MRRHLLIILLAVSFCALGLYGCGTSINGPDAAVPDGASEETPETPVVVSGASISATVALPELGSADISADLDVVAGKSFIGTKAAGDVGVDGTVTAVLPDGTELGSGTIVSGAVTGLVIPCDNFTSRDDKTFFINALDTNERSAATMCDATGCADGGTIDCETIDTESTLLTQLVLTEADANATPEDPAAFDSAVRAGTMKRPMEMRDTIKEMCGLTTAAIGSGDAASGCKAMLEAFRAKMAAGKVPYAEMNSAIQGNANVLADWQARSSNVTSVNMTTAMANLKGAVPAIKATYFDDTITGKFDQVTNSRQVFGAYFGKGTAADFNNIAGSNDGWEIHKAMLVQNADDYLAGTKTTFTAMEQTGAMMVTAVAERFTSGDIGTVQNAFVKLMDGLDYTKLTDRAMLFAAAEGAGNTVYAAMDSIAKMDMIINAPTTYGGCISANPTFYSQDAGVNAMGSMFQEQALNSTGFNSMNYNTIMPCTTSANCNGGKACICYRCIDATVVAQSNLEICSYCTASSQCKSQTCTGNACQMASGVDPFAGGTAINLKVVGESCTAGTQCYSGVCYSNHCAPCSGVQAPPSSLTATPGNGQVALSWPAKAGAEGYKVYWYLSGALVSSATSGGTSYTVTNLTNGTQYTFKIAAVEYGATGALSNAVTGTPVAAVSLSFTVSHFAGSLGGTGNANGVGANASFNVPQSITSDGTNLYVADTTNKKIRKIVIATGEVTTLTGSPNSPYGITTDGTNLYTADTILNGIQKIVIDTETSTLFAGNIASGSADGTGTAARFKAPAGITTDGTNLYVADTGNHTIRKVVISTGVVTTLAGTAGSSGTTDDTGTAARFKSPAGITTDGTNLYVADTGNYRIRKIVIATGGVTTLAGSSYGSTDGTGTDAQFGVPSGITTDGTNLYVTDKGSSNNTIRKVVISSGAVTTLAGTAGTTGPTDGTGAGARFNGPNGIIIDGANLYVADTLSSTIRKVVAATGVVTTFAGRAAEYGDANGMGSAARFKDPSNIINDGTNLYVADALNSSIRKIVSATANVTTVAIGFGIPYGITSDGTYLYVTNSCSGGLTCHAVSKVVIATGEITTLAGMAGTSGSADGTGTDARFNSPEGITTDGTNLYLADRVNQTIRKIIIVTGTVTTLAGTAGATGSTNGTGADARFNSPSGITTDGTNLYVTEYGGHKIRRVVMATGEVTTFAGGSSGSTDGIGTAAKFKQPRGITTDGTNLYVADTGNHTIRKIVISTGEVTTIAGTAGLFGFNDGVGSAARLNSPYGVAYIDSTIFVTESGNDDVRKIVIQQAE